MNDVVELGLIRVALICSSLVVEFMEHMFFSCPQAQQVWRYVANAIQQLLASRGNLGPRKSFSTM